VRRRLRCDLEAAAALPARPSKPGSRIYARHAPLENRPQMSVVEISGVSKAVGANNSLRGDRARIGEREFVSLIGPSGCGKSTLLRIIGDMIDPSGGKIVVNGKTARQARKDRDYGIIFQDPVLYDWRTVAKNVRASLEMARLASAENGWLASRRCSSWSS